MTISILLCDSCVSHNNINSDPNQIIIILGNHTYNIRSLSIIIPKKLNYRNCLKRTVQNEQITIVYSINYFIPDPQQLFR